MGNPRTVLRWWLALYPPGPYWGTLTDDRTEHHLLISATTGPLWVWGKH